LLTDLDNTLIPTGEFSKIARNAAIQALLLGKLKVDPQDLTRRLEGIIKKYGSNFSSHFDILLDELKVPSRQKSRLVARAVIAYHNAKHILQPYNDVPSALVTLHDQGYKQYVVSEGLSKKQWEKIFRTGIDLIIDDAFMTEDFGFKEKNEDFLKMVLTEVKVEPSECMMIGDRPDKDIRAANKMGITSVRVLTGPYKTTTENDEWEKAKFKIKKFSEILTILPLVEKRLG
jgi:putative hydrolase of the HAD superfamily